MFYYILCPVFFFFFDILAKFIVLYPILCIVSGHNICIISILICFFGLATLLGGLGYGNLGICPVFF